MAVVKFPIKTDPDKAIVKNVNLLMEDVFCQSNTLEELLEEGPAMLASYHNLTKILRAAKRTKDINAAINIHCLESCPPHKNASEDSEYCACTNCENCWKTFIVSYNEKIHNERNEAK